jgi:outer membrane murein-binding lipoprotein Lpp
MTLFRFVLVALVLLGTGCNQDKIAQLEKQNKELAAKLESLSKSAGLESQQKCAVQARIAFSQSGFGREGNSEYTNHYNQSLNRCFVRFFTLKTEGHASITHELIEDAFEGKLYAEYFWKNDKPNPGLLPKPILCTVTLPSGEEKECESSQQFGELVKVYMEK